MVCRTEQDSSIKMLANKYSVIRINVSETKTKNNRRYTHSGPIEVRPQLFFSFRKLKTF